LLLIEATKVLKGGIGLFDLGADFLNGDQIGVVQHFT
jgi:hypothetical protein